MSTTAKSKSSSAKTKSLRRPFTPGATKRARALAGRYTILVGFEPDDGCYVGRAVELPHQIGAGDTDAEALRETRELLVSTLATMIEDGQDPPPPGAESPRTEQVNFRVSIEEKARLEAAARRKGLTLVDYIRGSALAVTDTASGK